MRRRAPRTESLQILEGNPRATAIRGDIRSPQGILDHPQTRRLLDFDQPMGLLVVSVLHFVPEDTQAYDVVAQVMAALAPGSYLAASHAATESFLRGDERAHAIGELYKRQTAIQGAARTRSGTERFFTGLELVDPGVVWLHEWRPDLDDGSVEHPDEPWHSGSWAGVGRKP